jgi:hypothetical protein
VEEKKKVEEKKVEEKKVEQKKVEEKKVETKVEAKVEKKEEKVNFHPLGGLGCAHYFLNFGSLDLSRFF